MDELNYKILAPYVEDLFQEKGEKFSLSTTLGARSLGLIKATLRFIALKQAGSDLDKLFPINFKTVFTDQDYDESTWDAVKRIANNELWTNSIMVLRASRWKANIPSLTMGSDDWQDGTDPKYPVEVFLSKVFATKLFINKEQKKVLFVVERESSLWYKFLVATLFRTLPWFFGDGNPSPEYVEFFTMLSKKEGTEEYLLKVTDELVSFYNFEDEYFKRKLASWQSMFIEDKKEKLKRTAENSRDHYNQKMKEAEDFLKKMQEAMAEYMALQMSPKEEDQNEIYNFFKSHKNISLLSVARSDGDGEVRFSIVDTIDYYDEDDFKAIYNNPRSYLADSTMEIRKIAYEIFINHRGAFRTESLFELEGLNSIRPYGDSQNITHKDIAIPHPHLIQYHCLGQNREYISRYLSEGSWDLAIEQCIAAAKNIFFGDGTVMPYFFNDELKKYYEKDVKCIVADNGKDMSLKEFYEYVSKEKEEE